MKGANIVVHCAAIAGIDTVIKAHYYNRVNMIGSANVLKRLSHPRSSGLHVFHQWSLVSRHFVQMKLIKQ
jgi:nucleoside-diphosphate-sugar epimerase